MGKVLLAVNGPRPSAKIFRYALDLCGKLKTELSVFQVVWPSRYGGSIGRAGKQAGKCMETSFKAAAFAESGEHEYAQTLMEKAKKNAEHLKPESRKAGVNCSITMGTGEPEKEIVSFVDNHPEIVLTILDSGEEVDGNPRENLIRGIKKRLEVPLVLLDR
ncbi:MAG: universal stress protein [Desulfobacteraceae bacterium]